MENKINKNSNISNIIELEDEFKDIFNKMEYSNQNIFITGKAGTGKTTLLEYFRINSKKILLYLLQQEYLQLKPKVKLYMPFAYFHPEY